jgi:signal transduction histidine kinase
VRRGLVLVSLAVTTMVALAFVVPLALLTRELARDRVLGAAEDDAQLAARSLSALSQGTSYESTFLNLGIEGLTLVLPDGTAVGGSIPEGEDLTAAFAGAAGTSDVPGGAAAYVPVITAREKFVIRAFVSDDELTENVGRSWLVLGILGIVLVGVGIAVADRLGRTIVKPVEDLSAAAGRLSAGDLSARVEPSGPPELVEVGNEFNYLAERVADLLQNEREAVADLSHRLRTPLTAARLDAEALPPGPDRDRLVGDLDELERMVDHIIHEARRPTEAANHRSDLAAAVRERTAFWAALAEEQGRPTSLTLHGTEPWWVSLRVADLHAAIDALLGNVFAHTPDGTPYRVRALRESGVAVVEVEDDGPGLEHADLISRGESSGGSTGLGLDIARRTAEAANGSLHLADGDLGGASVTLRIPLER